MTGTLMGNSTLSLPWPGRAVPTLRQPNSPLRPACWPLTRSDGNRPGLGNGFLAVDSFFCACVVALTLWHSQVVAETNEAEQMFYVENPGPLIREQSELICI